MDYDTFVYLASLAKVLLTSISASASIIKKANFVLGVFIVSFSVVAFSIIYLFFFDSLQGLILVPYGALLHLGLEE